MPRTRRVNSVLHPPRRSPPRPVRHIPKIVALSGVAPPVLVALSEDLFTRVQTVTREGFARHLPRAFGLVEEAGARGDEDYVALAIALDAPIWTYDKDFRRIKGVRLIFREEIQRIGVKGAILPGRSSESGSC
ncbi:MAG TPA: PIN domain-containing protein [Thermoplasmata archaeon]|nr:PIN domain-containing protein [Thermoplasmata archaeon]